MVSRQTFQHRPLAEPGTFRLLLLEPSCKGQQLRCTIQHERLEGSRPYEALSYCWGLLESQVNVECDGQVIPVTVNCSAALLQLRHRFRRRVLWIDALCINQTSDTDKAAQIPLMGQIYSAADRVLVWLGDGALATNLVLFRLNAAARLDARLTRWALGKLKERNPDTVDPTQLVWDISGGLAGLKLRLGLYRQQGECT